MLPLALELLGGCLYADTLIGEWRSESVWWTPPNQTNRFESYGTVTFLEDGSFRFREFVKINTSPPTELPSPYKGTYKMSATNQIVLECAPNDASPSNKIPVVVSFTLSGDHLTLPVLSASAIAETREYRRVKR